MNTETITKLITHIRADADSGDSSLYGEIERNFKELMGILRTFLICRHDCYYGYFLRYIRVRMDFQCTRPVIPQVTGGEVVLLINPLLLCTYKVKEILYLLCQCVDHILYGHLTEHAKFLSEGNEEQLYHFDVSADAAVNDKLDKKAESEYRFWLIPPEERINSQKLAEQFSLGDIKSCQDWQYYFKLLQKQQDGQGGQSSSDMADSMDDELVEAVVNAFIARSVEMMGSQQRGLLPDELLETIRMKNAPPQLSWQQLLRQFVGTLPSQKRSTRTRLNRRQPERFDLSGRVTDRVMKIVAVIDTSGSVDDRMLKKIFNEIFAILSSRKHELTVIECDSQIQRIYKPKCRNDILTVKGRGGTAFTPVIEHLNADRYYRDALLIYFTDGLGERKIPRPMVSRCLWVIHGEAERLSLKEPYGMVVSMKEN